MNDKINSNNLISIKDSLQTLLYFLSVSGIILTLFGGLLTLIYTKANNIPLPNNIEIISLKIGLLFLLVIILLSLPSLYLGIPIFQYKSFNLEKYFTYLDPTFEEDYLPTKLTYIQIASSILHVMFIPFLSSIFIVSIYVINELVNFSSLFIVSIFINELSIIILSIIVIILSEFWIFRSKKWNLSNNISLYFGIFILLFIQNIFMLFIIFSTSKALIFYTILDNTYNLLSYPILLLIFCVSNYFVSLSIIRKSWQFGIYFVFLPIMISFFLIPKFGDRIYKIPFEILGYRQPTAILRFYEKDRPFIDDKFWSGKSDGNQFLTKPIHILFDNKQGLIYFKLKNEANSIIYRLPSKYLF